MGLTTFSTRPKPLMNNGSALLMHGPYKFVELLCPCIDLYDEKLCCLNFDISPYIPISTEYDAVRDYATYLIPLPNLKSWML